MESFSFKDKGIEYPLNNCEKIPDDFLKELCKNIDKVTKKDYPVPDININKVIDEIFAKVSSSSKKIAVDEKKVEMVKEVKKSLKDYNEQMKIIENEIKPKLEYIKELNKELLRLRILRGGLDDTEYMKKISEKIELLSGKSQETFKKLGEIEQKINIAIGVSQKGGNCACGGISLKKMKKVKKMDGGKRKISKKKKVSKKKVVKGGDRDEYDGGKRKVSKKKHVVKKKSLKSKK